MSANLTKTQVRERKSLDATTDQMDTCLVTIRGLRDLAQKEASLVQNALRDMENNLIDPVYTLELTKSIHRSGSRNIDDYVKRNTEILLNEHATVVRQNVIRKMKNQIQEMNAEMSEEAKKLGDDISNFFDFIQNSYSLASNSFKKVTDIAKRNYDKVELVMVSENKLFTLKTELQELEQQMLECLMCSEFLKTLSPERYEKEAFHIRKEFLRSFGPTYSDEQRESLQKEVLEELLAKWKLASPVDVSGVSSAEVTKLIGRLKESNLSLVHFSRGTSAFETTELAALKEQMNDELTAWDEKIANAEAELELIQKMHDKLKRQIWDLEAESARNKELRETEVRKMAEIYKLCTGSEVHVTDPVLMRVAVDHSMQGILIEMNTQPRKKVKELLKILEAEKKLSERKAEEAMRAQRATERLRKALTPAIGKERKQAKKKSK
ncbi:uncharacterized protein LOC129966879 isoform X1 [Argiope bruennichi]|uniref:uncharacterized protein LOC129966879 isoform X1 n=1 Tax=Argiope bruennichi TaxID=94029 RepID=UPI0024950401|nr:uncharacterized protein LOC129966879 isoform X1 [Argiope bruennichi]